LLMFLSKTPHSSQSVSSLLVLLSNMIGSFMFP
jgi:hypothetical protein